MEVLVMEDAQASFSVNDMDETAHLVLTPTHAHHHPPSCFRSCFTRLVAHFRANREHVARTVEVGTMSSLSRSFPRNIIRNQKYNIFTFIPKVLYQQFRFFLNLYFLVMACSQFIPVLKIGYLYTYWAPLTFVLTVTLIREAADDVRRYYRDREVNSCMYKKLTINGMRRVTSANISVGDLVYVEKDERVPADMILLRTTEKSGSCFIRTDQLDGETDWKLRVAVPACQSLDSDQDLFDVSAYVHAEKPQRDIHSFIGAFISDGDSAEREPLAVDNTLWANTVVASGMALGIVIYTGIEGRSVMNTCQPKQKVGLFDRDVNNLSKLLFGLVLLLSFAMTCLRGFSGPWFVYAFRFVLLFSFIIPLSLRVNLDLGKMVYAWLIQRDKKMPGNVVRSTTIPEELARVGYLMADKTGTLTCNEMVLKRLHLGTVSFGEDTFQEVAQHLKSVYSEKVPAGTSSVRAQRRTLAARVRDATQALALCHNVTPVFETSGDNEGYPEADQQGTCIYQASSPDEVALVKWTEQVGLALVNRDLNSLQLRTPTGETVHYTILEVFPFTSESKRMGIILREEATGEILFYLKGADVVMMNCLEYRDWLEEECGNLAREGLRTLVVAKKVLSEEEYAEFSVAYKNAKLATNERASKMSAVIDALERRMELICVTGVEDMLQEDVRPTLELLRNAGVKVWMLTGDKMETATCIAKSSCLVSRNHDVYTFKHVRDRTEVHLELNSLRRRCQDSALIISGTDLRTCLTFYESEFMEVAMQAPTVVCCRCSPDQKAQIVGLVKSFAGKRTAAIGDGGNDVSMIQTADVGIGIVGKEGKQASLASDFSLLQFSHVSRLLVIHGRNSYKRSAALSNFVIHRGLFITTMQAIFSSVFYLASVALYPGFLYVGFTTLFTMFPVFSLVLDKDVSEDVALTFPELYKALAKGRSLSYKTFFMWVLITLYQGAVIMYGSLFLFDNDFMHIISISFTALIFTELLMVPLNIRTWHYLMVLAELLSLTSYIVTLVMFRSHFDANFLTSLPFLWKSALLTVVSFVPLYILKYLRRKIAPPVYSKLT